MEFLKFLEILGIPLFHFFGNFQKNVPKGPAVSLGREKPLFYDFLGLFLKVLKSPILGWGVENLDRLVLVFPNLPGDFSVAKNWKAQSSEH